MNKYIYAGPVKEFDKVIDNNWYGETMADSETKARNNLAYQFKKEDNSSWKDYCGSWKGR